jgi:hypothetical protein
MKVETIEEVDCNLSIKSANLKIKKLENNLTYYISEKNRYYNMTQPKSASMSERVQGGNREDKNAKYVVACERLDPIIDDLNYQIKNLSTFLENSLKLLGKYNDIEKKIYDLRLNNILYEKLHRGKKMEWWKIAENVGLSERQCRRIYSKLINKRNID